MSGMLVSRAMCQLLGLNANTPTDLVFSFTGFAHRAVEHKDGFGIAFFDKAGTPVAEKPITCATDANRTQRGLGRAH